MNKIEKTTILGAMAENSGINNMQSGMAYDSLVEFIGVCLKERGEIYLPELGLLKTNNPKQRYLRNIGTGEWRWVKVSKNVKLKICKNLKKLINE
jgi:nucleoid DNA-binding protein